MSEVKVNKVTPRSGTTLTIGDSGDTTNVVGTLQNNGAALVGDISSVVAGTNLSGGGTSGAVTLNLADASTSAKGAASFSSDNFAASSGAVTIKDLGIATAEIQDAAVTTAKINDDAITLGKMAPGTDGNIISYDASGNPVAVATGSATQVLTSAGAGAPPVFADAASGIEWQSSIVTASTLSAVSGRGYWINTTSNACTITLPGSASVGDQIIFTDYARKWGTNAVTINQNSLKFQGNTSPNPVYDTTGQSVDIVYSGAAVGWIPNSDNDVAFETKQSTTANFLVIAGGGGGGSGGAGAGGAGGYRASFNSEASGGGGSSETALELTPGAQYTVTIGAGASGGSTNADGATGSNSSISGTGITTITSSGGSGGAGNGRSAGAGGSGGGGAGKNSGSPTSGGAGTSNQGFAGGAGGVNAPQNGAGGGGGAGAVGAAGTANSGGAGGTGVASTITASSVTRAGGGGGSGKDNLPGGSGGTGGGGAGNSSGGSNSPVAGTANTGSGGGGGHDTSGANAGSGVVILRMLTSAYSGTTSGSPTVSTSSGDTILTFNSSGSYTA